VNRPPRDGEVLVSCDELPQRRFPLQAPLKQRQASPMPSGVGLASRDPGRDHVEQRRAPYDV
jgi:hypothetical protein